MEPWQRELLISSWAIWSVAMILVICRFLSRRMALGSFRRYQVDDWLMVLCAASYTGVVVTSNEVAVNGSNYIPEGEELTWTEEQYRQAEWGSKMLIAFEEFTLGTLWLVKTCLLILYYRMTRGLRENIAVKVVAVYVFIGYVVIQVLYLGVWCRPFTNYWAIPVPADQEQCKTYLHHMIVVTVFNVSSDLAMLCIPVPLIARSRLPLKRKLVLCGVFSMGILTVLVAILNRYFNFTESYSMIFLNWYNAEACTAVLIANIPFCWSLLRRVFRLGAWDPDKNSDEAESGFATGQHPPTIGHAIWGGADRRRRTGETTILGLDTTVTANTANEIPDAAASPKRVSTGGTTEKSAAFTRDSQHEPSLFRPADGDGKTDSK